VAGDHLKFARVSIALDFVDVAFAFGVGDGEATRRDELTEVLAMAVEGDGVALGLRDFEKVPPDGGQTNRLRRRSTGIGNRHFLRSEIENAEGQGHKNE